MKDYLPKEVLKRKKQGFGTPINLWINTSLKETSGDILDRLERRSNIICPNFIKKIKRNRFSKLFENVSWNLIMFELWYETFIEKQSLYPISF